MKNANQEVSLPTSTVCAIVVTYNRKELLSACLDRLLNQTRPIDALYIIDNYSNDGTADLLKEKGYISELPCIGAHESWKNEFEIGNLVDAKKVQTYYLRMNENTGGAGGFHEGVKRGYNKGFDWLWLMDDDCLPSINCLEEQLNQTPINAYSTPVKINIDLPLLTTMHNEKKKHRSDRLPFNCFLISKNVISKIGYPRKDFYIDRDDIEYGLRANSENFYGYIISSAYVNHPIDNHFTIPFFKKKFMNFGAKEKVYYKVRNSIVIALAHRLYMKSAVKTIVREFTAILFFEFSIHRLFLFLKAILHATTGRMGKL